MCQMNLKECDSEGWGWIFAGLFAVLICIIISPLLLFGWAQAVYEDWKEAKKAKLHKK